MSGSGLRGGRRIPTPMPPPKEAVHQPRSSPRLVGSDASYKLSPYEMEALNAVKASVPKMDRNGYFFYVTSTAKKKKINLMQPKPPRVAFAEEKRRPGVAERVCTSVAQSATEYGRGDPMSQRGLSPAPRARLYTQLESYQPRYHTIRDNSDKRVESECRRRKKEQRIVGYPQPQQQQITRTSTAKCSGGSPHRERRRRDEDGTTLSGFSAALHRAPPPPPPALLRRLGVKEPTGVGKVKVMLRVGASGEGPFTSGTQTFSMDKRKKQVSLCETAPAASAPEDRKVGVAAPKMFAFDAIFSQDDAQTEICSSALTDVIHAVINGTDGCLFCFGHAGLGKSYTMLGRPDTPTSLGAIPCAITWLFRGIAEQRHKCGTRFSVRVSAVELCTNTNQIRDLLAPYQNDTEQSPGVYLRDDPLFGTHLQNQSELRVHSAEKAAFYLDAALATRGTREEGKDSHLLYTLHVYQYSVGGKGAVAGGRSRLHLIDLGNSERGKTNGGIPLSGLGNILLAIFNGQRHLPYRDHNLTHVLKECLGSLTCHTAMIVHVSPNAQNYSDTLTTLQLASRIHRLRRRKVKYSANNNAGSGGSSGEDASKPSSSEPDPSSSDLSADTVIYVGPLDDATDGEHPPVYIPHINSGDNRCVMSKALRGSAADQKHKSTLSKVVEEKSPVHKLHSSPKASPLKTLQPSHTPKASPAHSATSKSTPLKKAGQKQFSEEGKSNSDEQWIDGPRISKSKLVEARHIIKETQGKKRETWIDGPMQEPKVPIQFESVPMQSLNPLPLQMGILGAHGSENLGYGYMDNHKKNMIRKWVENQTSQIHKSRHNSPSHRGQAAQKEPGKTAEEPETAHKMEPVTKDSVRRIHVEESTIRTGLKAGSKGMAIEEENVGPPLTDTAQKKCPKPTKNDIDEDDDSEELAEIPPALPIMQPSSLSSREVSMESLDSKYKERLRMDDEYVSNHSRDIDPHGMSRGPNDDEDEILEIYEFEEPLEPVPMQDSCLQVTEEDIAFCMGLSENPLPEVDQEDLDDHPLRILSQENLTVASTFTDTLSLYSEVERQIRNEAYLRQTIGFYAEKYNGERGFDLNPHDSLPSSRSRIDDLMSLTELYGSRRMLDNNETSITRIAPQFQSLSLSNVRDTEEFGGDGSVYSEPAYRPSDKICNSCKRTMSRPGSAVGECDAYQDLEAHNDCYGPFERYRGNDITDARIASLRHPDGASDPNLREERERRIPGSGAPSFKELKSNLHLEVTAPVVTTEPRTEKSDKGIARVVASSKPDGYDSGHESTPRTGKHSPATTSRRAESGYDSVPRDSDASSLDSYPTRRAAVARAHAKKHTTAKYKQHSDRSFCSWLRNPFTCKYADTDPEISDF
ncbi:kinesin-like protein CG14535 isoform X1 [Trichoplusia ni]|uniref:Kinesin-like protein CG14535 isoform X1 n=1 Tax=Trichoplusia ni TaxID=7111 RepID=A0A7E5VWB5_TRINI|nr:kinesin-like protein CG14535 isoform X1 [Trichoplusia ni]